jgi:hypothetical protein
MESYRGSGRLLFHQQHRTSALDFAGDLSMKMCWHTGDPSRQNFTAFSHEFLEQIRVFIVDSLCGYVDSTPRHNPICPSKIRSAFGVLGFHDLLHLAMQGASAEERIVLFFLQPAWCVGAFFVASTNVTRNRLACRSRFRALKSDDFPRHGS